MLEAGCTNLG